MTNLETQHADLWTSIQQLNEQFPTELEWDLLLDQDKLSLEQEQLFWSLYDNKDMFETLEIEDKNYTDNLSLQNVTSRVELTDAVQSLKWQNITSF